MKPQLVSLMVICLVVAQSSAAGEAEQEQPWNRHKGFYVEGNLGTGFGYFPLTTINSEWDEVAAGIAGFSWVGALGYGLTSHHAVEGGFGQYYTPFKDEDEEHNDSGHLNIGYLAWRGTVPIKDRWALFGKLGAMNCSTPDGEVPQRWAPFSGLGVSYAVTPQIDVSLQYEGAVYVVVGAGMLTLGVTYHF